MKHAPNVRGRHRPALADKERFAGCGPGTRREIGCKGPAGFDAQCGTSLYLFPLPLRTVKTHCWREKAARFWTEEDGLCWAFICIDHYNLDPVVTMSKSGTRFDALDPVLKAVRDRFGGVGKGIYQGVALRPDHGSQYTSRT